MSNKSKNFALFLTLIIALSCLTLLIVKPANAQSKPTVPEFTAKYADNSYHASGNYIENKSVEVTIKNQPSPYVLCFNVRAKDNLAQNWTSYEYYDNSSYLAPELFIPNRLLAWNSTETVLVFGFEGNNGSDTYNLVLGNGTGDQIDFQVQAYLGNWFPGRLVNATAKIDYYLLNIDAVGDWSPTQTITIPESAIPVFPLLALITVLAVVSVSFVFFKRRKSKTANVQKP